MELTDLMFLNQTRDQGWDKEKMTEVMNSVFSTEKAEEKETVLEVGCGNGRITRFFAQKNPSKTFCGVDIDSDLLRDAKRKAKEDKSTNVSFHVKNIQKKQEAIYDVVYTHYTLVDTKEPIRLLRDAYNMVKKDGILCSVEPLYQCDCNNVYIPGLDNDDKDIMSKLLKKILISIPESKGIDRLVGMKLPAEFKKLGLKDISIKIVSAFDYGKEYDNERKKAIIKASEYVINNGRRYFDSLKISKLWREFSDEELDQYYRLQSKIAQYILRNPESYFEEGNFTYGNEIVIKGKKSAEENL